MKNIALILLYDDKKRFLLQYRTDDAPTYPNYYGFFGGKIEEGETPRETIKRECIEELEYEPNNPILTLNTVRDCKYGKINIYLFLEKYDSNKKLILHEGQYMKWVNLEEVNDLKIIDFLKDILIEMYSKI